ALMAATIAIVQNDIKRVVAYSTCSQLGYMFAAAGVSAYQAAMFHLFTHAFFKALLFLGAGSVIHAMHDEQDMRKMGGLFQHIPATWLVMVIGTIALTGFGFPGTPIGFAGFFSKDSIIESAFAANTPQGMIAFILTVVAAFLTSVYSWRLILMTFHGKHKMSEQHLREVHESPPVMLIPLFILAFGAMFAGLFSQFFIGKVHELFWASADVHRLSSLVVLPSHNALEFREHVPEWVHWAPFLVTIGGFATSYYFYVMHPEIPPRIGESRGALYLLAKNKWYFDEIYDFLFVRPIQRLAVILWKGGDGRIIDGLGPDGIAARVQDGTQFFVKLETGYLYHYAFAMLIGIAAAVTFIIWRMGGGG
ncbi:MAG TPA: proton-conducting transporter membrane subunit, partial [Alphaproteobacteria bacterium]|nr:proton-conducting transporter membrane subunit [Alphaproteobacteria bacterium]